MNKFEICRITGGALIVLISFAMGLAGVQLWKGGPSVWPDVIAGEVLVRRVAGTLLVLAAMLAISGVGAIRGPLWGGIASSVGIVFVVGIAFWGNHLLFGSIRPVHTIPNVVIAALIIALFWFGYSKN